MRKIRNIFLMALSFVFCSAFAITEEQKEAFVGAVDATVKHDNTEVFRATVAEAAKLAEVAPIAQWAQENPLEFNEWIKDRNNRYIWTVRVAVDKKFEAGSILDAVISDFDSAYLSAIGDKGNYKALKAKDFSIDVDGQTLRMSVHKIFALGKKHCDVDVFDAVPEAFWSDKFLECVNIIRGSKQDAGKLFNACNKVERAFFAKRKTDEVVKANWEAFQTDANEIFMAYYKNQKLKSLNK